MIKNFLKPLSSDNIYQTVFFLLLCLLAAAMPTSRFAMSFVQILMGVNWLLEGQYKEKTQRFIRNKPAVVFSMLFGVQIIGLLWTQDLVYGIGSDLKDKIPMLTLTFLVVSSRPLSIYKIHFLLYIFFAAVLVTTFIGFVIYITGNYTNFRHISPYVSHLYLSMMIVMTIFTLPWLTQKITTQKKWLWTSLGISLWLIIFLFILRSMTGLLCLAGVMVFLMFRSLVKSPQWTVKAIMGLALLLITGVILSLSARMYSKISSEIDPGTYETDQYTAMGNPYRHLPEEMARENGHYVYRFIAEDELRDAWNERSTLDYDGEDAAGNELKVTLFRYMSSLGLKKDREALESLQPEDIHAIENGTANYLYTQWPGVLVRVHQTIWELYWYQQTGNPTNHTFTQRVELWKGSWIAFLEKPLLGWGTGDIFIGVRYGLEQMNSPMENYHMKPHNQYLLFLVSFGVIGSMVIYVLYFYYVKLTRAYRFLPFNLFLIIMLISSLGMSPIDSQAGQTFFTFFTLYFGILYPHVDGHPVLDNG